MTPQHRSVFLADSTALFAAFWLSLSGCATVGGGAPSGGEERPDSDEQKAMQTVGEQVKGKIVWSSSREGNHDLFVMNTDGSAIRQITKGENVDWFPRFSPDGSHILFTRSKKGWVFERDANSDGKWDIFTVTPDGSEETKVVDNASWGSWLSNDEIVYARGTRIYKRALSGGEESLLVDSGTVPDLDGALMQQPEMSRDGKYIAITLRGSKRETGLWDIEKKKWTRTGEGCQINWVPGGDEVYWVHPTGNGGSRVLHMPVAEGQAVKSDQDPDKMVMVDIPGRRSHEYFPQLSADGKWLVWAATQRGHDHDIADYEIYLWQVGADAKSAARLTYHSGNDRWPDIFIPGAAGAATAGDSPKAEEGSMAKAGESRGQPAKELAAETATSSDDATSGEEASSKASAKHRGGHHGKKHHLKKKSKRRK